MAGRDASASGFVDPLRLLLPGLGQVGLGGLRGAPGWRPKYFVTHSFACDASKSPVITSTALFGA